MNNRQKPTKRISYREPHLYHRPLELTDATLSKLIKFRMVFATDSSGFEGRLISFDDATMEVAGVDGAVQAIRRDCIESVQPYIVEQLML